MSTAPTFISTDENLIINEMVAKYEELTGRSLLPAQAERLLINAFAYREKLVREQIQYAATQMLVSFAVAPALDYLAELVGVTRLPEQGASTTIRFTLVAGHGGVIIPAGLRVGSIDGKVVFSTQEATDVDAGDTTVDLICFCDNLGTIGHDYTAGVISSIRDPQAYLETASNTTTTTGGADAETDDELRERVKLAPAQFSTAGPRDAYIFFAKSASSTIVDVAVTSPTPGTVNVYPLVEGGVVTPPGTLSLVEAALNDEQVRPLTDTVVVASPTVTSYDIEVEIVIYTAADSGVVETQIEANLQDYADERQALLGRDIKVDQIKALCIYDDELVFEATVIAPAADVVIGESEVGVMGTLSVTITGSDDG